LAIAFSLTG